MVLSHNTHTNTPMAGAAYESIHQEPIYAMGAMHDDILPSRMAEYLKLKEIAADFDDITNGFELSMREALQKSGNCMLPCYNVVCEDNVNLQGSTVVIDIGGSTLRISVVQLFDDRKGKCLVNESWIIKDSMKHLDRSFFKWIAENFKSVIDENLMSSLQNSAGAVNVGLTWSFPIIQNKAPNRGIVSDLGKGFSVSQEFKGGDLKDIFESCFAESDIKIEIGAIVNDSIAVFIAGAYLSSSKLGLVQGTGVNSSFLIPTETLSTKKIASLNLDPSALSKLLINSEASFLGDHLLRYMSSADLEMSQPWSLLSDPSTPAPHLTTSIYGVFQPLEILSSGRYIPEIVRRLVSKFYYLQEGKWCPDAMFTDSPGNEYTLTAESLSKLYTSNTESKLLHILKIATKCVVERASYILSAYIIAMIRVTDVAKDTQNLCIAVVGSMLKHFPGYLPLVEEIMLEKCTMFNLPPVEFDFVQDSSIFGAAIAALGEEYKKHHL